MQEYLQTVSPILETWEARYMEILEAAEHPDVEHQTLHEHLIPVCRHFRDAVVAGKEIAGCIADIGSEVAEITAKKGFLGITSPVARSLGMAVGASFALVSLADSINGALACNAGASEIADRIDAVADKLAIALYRFRSFMSSPVLDNAIDIPQLMRIRLGLKLSRSSYLIGDRALGL